MVAIYTIAGKQIGSHILAMATLGAVVGGATIAMSGKKTQTTPPIQAGSSDEEKFIKEFIAKAEAESAKEKH
ncbi:hypothetical protein Q9L58_002526 [Maublancomyces gigas]|uniref:ATP synthase subunit K, mitochondrial n=1 Tax=Discina gigas TaxID=1032678 RepID=A0ABR3GR20_9PEZI